MKASEVTFQFPLLGFTPDRDMWGFQDLNTLTSCGPQSVKDNRQVGMELIDSSYRRWIVRSLTRTGRAGPFLVWLIMGLLSTRQSRIELELEEIEPVSLSYAQSKAVAGLEAFPEFYCADDEREEVLEPLIAQVKAASSVAEIFELLGLDSFMAY